MLGAPGILKEVHGSLSVYFFKKDKLQYNYKATLNCLKHEALKSIIQLGMKLNFNVFDEYSQD